MDSINDIKIGIEMVTEEMQILSIRIDKLEIEHNNRKNEIKDLENEINAIERKLNRKDELNKKYKPTHC